MSAVDSAPDQTVSTNEHNGTLVWSVNETRSVKRRQDSWTRGRVQGQVSKGGRVTTDFAMVLGVRQCGEGLEALSLCVSWGKPIISVKDDDQNDYDVLSTTRDAGMDDDSIVLSNHLEIVNALSVVAKVEGDRDVNGVITASSSSPRRRSKAILLCDQFRMHRFPGSEKVVLKFGTVEKQWPSPKSPDVDDIQALSEASGSPAITPDAEEEIQVRPQKAVRKIGRSNTTALTTPASSGGNTESKKSAHTGDSTPRASAANGNGMLVKRTTPTSSSRAKRSNTKGGRKHVASDGEDDATPHRRAKRNAETAGIAVIGNDEVVVEEALNTFRAHSELETKPRKKSRKRLSPGGQALCADSEESEHKICNSEATHPRGSQKATAIRRSSRNSQESGNTAGSRMEYKRELSPFSYIIDGLDRQIRAAEERAAQALGPSD
ncbi:hypothetical protein BDZ85DRAFT_249124 [Elsinoe ampelina]|uniref:Uncharacterized protein n=1 Tax=Elsinoe ampelina TaxID=302913 RepID=A0A6A6GFF7_9PEZI|nr:hypothetical protein BDZ85DRAFT_249124 [Elsinoe ampelina]